jgi:hypothetical protein
VVLHTEREQIHHNQTQRPPTEGSAAQRTTALQPQQPHEQPQPGNGQPGPRGGRERERAAARACVEKAPDGQGGEDKHAEPVGAGHTPRHHRAALAHEGIEPVAGQDGDGKGVLEAQTPVGGNAQHGKVVHEPQDGKVHRRSQRHHGHGGEEDRVRIAAPQ